MTDWLLKLFRSDGLARHSAQSGANGQMHTVRYKSLPCFLFFVVSVVLLAMYHYRVMSHRNNMLLSYPSAHTRECPPSSCHRSRRTLSSIHGSWTARTSKTPADTVTVAVDSTIGINVLMWSPSVLLCVQVYYHSGGPNTVQISVFDALC